MFERQYCNYVHYLKSDIQIKQFELKFKQHILGKDKLIVKFIWKGSPCALGEALGETPV